MFLLIDLSTQQSINLGLFDANSLVEKKTLGSNRDLLLAIDNFCSEQNIDSRTIGGIVVVVGAGSFTNTRIATTAANTFGYVLKIPLLAIKKEFLGKLPDIIPQLLSQPIGQYCSAIYSAEPNIGRK